jgi:hypothetical protein
MLSAIGALIYLQSERGEHATEVGREASTKVG